MVANLRTAARDISHNHPHRPSMYNNPDSSSAVVVLAAVSPVFLGRVSAAAPKRLFVIAYSRTIP